MSRWNFLPAPVATDTITWTLVLGTDRGNRFVPSSYSEDGTGAGDWTEYPHGSIRTNGADTYIEFLVRIDTGGTYSNNGDFTTNATISDSRFLHESTEMSYSSLTIVEAGGASGTILRFRFNASDTSSFYDAFATGDTLTIGLTYS